MDSILYAKEKQLLNIKREIEENYEYADIETKKIYDKELELIDLELDLIYKYIPKRGNSKTR